MTTIDTSDHTGAVIDGTRTRRRSSTARHLSDESTDAEILDSIRNGDQRAFDVLYRRHRPAVQRLARRLARNAADADDIVSEVFAATLRATLAGRGPTDDAGPYLLRSVRNTATSIGTRGDGRRTTATAHDDLAVLTPPTQPVERDDEVSEAFRDLPDRFRDVLWSTEIEGATPAELAGNGADAGAVASLSHRARCALRRSYLSVSTRSRCTDPACRSTRSAMPSVVLGDAAASTVARVDRHVVTCGDCAAVFDQMQMLAERMPSRSLLAVLLAFIKNLGGVTASVVGGAAPIIVVPAAVATLTAGAIVATDVIADRDTSAPDPTEQAIDPPSDPEALATQESDQSAEPAETPAAAPTPASPASPRLAVDPPVDLVDNDGAKSTVPSRSAPSDPAPGLGGDGVAAPSSADPAGATPVDGDADGAVDGVVDAIDDAIDDPITTSSGALGSTIDAIDDVVDGLGDGVDETVETLADGVDTALDPVTGTIDTTVDELESALGTVVEPVTGALEPIVEPVVEPVVDLVDEVGGSVLGTDVDLGTDVPSTLPAVPSTDDLVDDTTDLVVDVTDGVTDLVGGLLGG